MSYRNLPLHRPSRLVRISRFCATAVSAIAGLGAVALAWRPGDWRAASLLMTWVLMMVLLGWALQRFGTAWAGTVNVALVLAGYGIVEGLFRTEWFWREIVPRHGDVITDFTWRLPEPILSVLLFLAFPVVVIEVILWRARRRHVGPRVALYLSLSILCVGMLLLANVVIDTPLGDILFLLVATMIGLLGARGLSGSGAWVRQNSRKNQLL